MVEQVLPLAASCVTLVVMWLAGNNDRRAWWVGLGGQTIWLSFIVVFAAWGLLPLSVALVGVYTRNIVRGRREAALAQHLARLPRRVWDQCHIDPGGRIRVSGEGHAQALERFVTNVAGADVEMSVVAITGTRWPPVVQVLAGKPEQVPGKAVVRWDAEQVGTLRS